MLSHQYILLKENYQEKHGLMLIRTEKEKILRRLYQELIAYLFECVSPKVENNLFMTKSGKEIDVSGEHFNNKLSAIIETLEDKTVKKSLIGSSIMYYLDWIENLTSLQSKGVHNNISLEEARSCIIQTYIFAGEIINLYNNSNK